MKSIVLYLNETIKEHLKKNWGKYALGAGTLATGGLLAKHYYDHKNRGGSLSTYKFGPVDSSPPPSTTSSSPPPTTSSSPPPTTSSSPPPTTSSSPPTSDHESLKQWVKDVKEEGRRKADQFNREMHEKMVNDAVEQKRKQLEFENEVNSRLEPKEHVNQWVNNFLRK